MSDDQANEIETDVTTEPDAAEADVEQIQDETDVVDGEVLTEEEADEPELGAPSVAAALEALLLLADEPMTVVALAQATHLPVDEIEAELRRLSAEYTEALRGFDLREVAGGWRFYTRAECSPLVERWVLDGQQAKLTQAALETLAVIAYRQPVTRGRVSAVRGVNVDGVIRTLLSRGLIEEAGHEQDSNAILYRTTGVFLERLGISSLDELPPLAEHLPDLAELDDLLDAVATGE